MIENCILRLLCVAPGKGYNMTKDKNTSVMDFMQMTYNSWTYNKMSTDEKNRLADVVAWCTNQGIVKGTWKQRWDIMQAVYWSFLQGIGYDGPCWRD